MITKIKYGTPIETGTVVGKADAEADRPIFLTQVCNFILSYRLGQKDVVYGLGEAVRGINKRGWRYTSSNINDSLHTEDKQSLYAAHNFILVDGAERFGVFVDYAGTITWDIGYSDLNLLTISVDRPDFYLYIITAPTESQIICELRQLTGRSYIPPKWAFGYGQSRWSYMNADEVRTVVKKHRELGLPLDVVWLDIDYMENYKDFSISEAAFPNMKEFVDEMRREGVHLAPVIDAGVKIEDGYDIYEEGKNNGYFCKRADESDFVAGVWPGRVCFPDFLNEEAREWFGSKYKLFLDMGIYGFWNDMNEPAIFYSEENLEEVFNKISEYRSKNLDIYTFFTFKNMVSNISRHAEDYELFWHECGDEKIRHDKVHNLFGYNMVRAAADAFDKMAEDKRVLLISRSSCIGAHRYSGVWTGDNYSWWSHLLLNIRMMPSLNMCGFLFSGGDIGGFSGNTTEDLMMRWLAFGVFTPLMRNHSAMATRRQELWEFSQTEGFRNIVRLRYILLPYIYSEFMKAVLNDGMYFKPLSFDYPDDEDARTVEDELMVGESILIAPVYEQNATGRYVYLPEEMLLVRWTGDVSMSRRVYEKGRHYIHVALDEVIFFIRPDHLVPVSRGGDCVERTDFNHLMLLEFIKHKAVYELYDDDGETRDYQNPAHYATIYLEKDGEPTVSATRAITVERLAEPSYRPK